ncbi:MAG: hypothetical protein AB9869_01035 [Verrucomicrobiia bacterium]
MVIAIVAIQPGMLLPVLSKAKAKGQAIVCLNTLTPLQMAWLVYTHENDRWKAPNYSRREDTHLIQPGGDREDHTWLLGGLPRIQ